MVEMTVKCGQCKKEFQKDMMETVVKCLKCGKKTAYMVHPEPRKYAEYLKRQEDQK